MNPLQKEKEAGNANKSRHQSRHHPFTGDFLCSTLVLAIIKASITPIFLPSLLEPCTHFKSHSERCTVVLLHFDLFSEPAINLLPSAQNSVGIFNILIFIWHCVRDAESARQKIKIKAQKKFLTWDL